MFSKQTKKKKILYKVDYPNAFNLTYQLTKSNINKHNAKKKKKNSSTEKVTSFI